jgi:hypothetical protein
MLGAAGMVAQAALGAWWLPRLTADAPVLPADRNGALLSLQFFAFQLPFVLGVSMQALPRFFAYRHLTPTRILPVAASLAAGSALHAGARLLLDGSTGVRLEQTGALLVALAIAGTISQTGVWRAPDRLRRSARNAAVLIRTAYVWLTLVVLVLLLTSTTALVTGEPVPPYQADAVRHLLAIGVFSTMIMAMAQLMLPWLAMRRQWGQSSSIEVWTLWGLWTSATVLRVAGALLEGQGVGAVRYWPMAVAGLLGLVALAFFAVTLLRATRTRAPEIPVHALDQRVSSA